MNNSIFKERSNTQKLLIYFLIVFFSLTIVSFIGSFVISFFFQNPTLNISPTLNNNSIRALKWSVFFNHLGMFLIPSWLFLFVLHNSPFQFWGKPKTNLRISLIIPLFLGISILGELALLVNQQIDFRFFSEEFALYAEQADATSKLLINLFIGTTWKSFLFNVFLIALVPAIGEELMFRGILQPLLIRTTRQKHFAIFSIAFLFAFIHFQFSDFIPRFVLGIVYGYIFYFTNNIKYTIILHFLNNFSALILYLLPRIIDYTNFI